LACAVKSSTKIAAAGLALLLLTVLPKLAQSGQEQTNDAQFRQNVHALGGFLQAQNARELHEVPLRPDIWSGWHFRFGGCEGLAFLVDGPAEQADRVRLKRRTAERLLFVHRGTTSENPPRYAALWDTALYFATRSFRAGMPRQDYSVAIIAPPDCAVFALPWARLWR
jgi:hypothetical protein